MDRTEEWSGDWRQRVGPLERSILDAAVEAGARTGTTPYLVGGPVRDLALGIPFSDVDLLIEGDGNTFASELSGLLAGELRRFPSFLTWRIEFRETAPVDITTARTETYPEPGALPVVTAASVKADLFRRDFAANSVALNLMDGALIDPTGGLSDIQDRHLRILHPRSFLDDPTRMLRGVRLSERLGFSMEEATAEAMREAIAQDALSWISRERVWREILLSLREPSPARALVALTETKMLDRFLDAPAPGPELLYRVEAILKLEPAADRAVVYAGALLANAMRPEAALDGAGFSHARHRKAAGLFTEGARLSRSLDLASTPLDQLRLCAGASLETRVIASALSGAAAETVQRFRDFPDMELEVRGDELGLPYGPHIAKALEAAREAVYLRVIPREEARDFARRVGLQYLKGEID
jgi:tRNA nucleotidyltransferase/poly(A) polymerase